MNFKDELSGLKSRIDKELELFTLKELKGSSFYDGIREYVLRDGKRLRPILVVKGFECFKELKDEVVKASLAYELIHASLLVEDDIMDNSDLRRWEPSLHKVFSTNSGKEGESLAILASMILQVLSEKALIESGFGDGTVLRTLSHLQKIVLDTCEGQKQDVVLSGKVLSEVREGDVMSIMRLKTSKYSIEGPLVLGSILAGRAEDFSGFAHPLGLAFQIKDDVLGLMGDEEEIGKPVTSDLAEGKKTLLVVKAFELCSDKDRKTLLKLLGKKNVSVKDLGKVRQIVSGCGALDYCNSLMNKLVEESVNNIKPEWSQPVKFFLKELCHLVVNRSS